jgi:hypothetical protein
VRAAGSRCRLLLACGILLATQAGCGHPPVAAPVALLGDVLPVPGADFEARVQEMGLPELDPDTVFYDEYSVTPLDLGPEDADGVPLVDVDGTLYYHPVKIAQRGLRFVWSFEQTGDSAYLDYARRFASRLRLMAKVTSDGSRYYPYPFDLDLHHLPGEVLYAPWYSGMAQGQALSFLVRLYRLTGDEAYREAADSTFLTFLRPKTSTAHPTEFTAHVDTTGYYWVDEYPMERQDNDTLNGFIYAVFGLYDYYRLTGDGRARQLILASLTTLRAYLPQFRVPGEPSYYCLRHQVQDPKYHKVHIGELHTLYIMSGDYYFQSMSDAFRRDYPG